MSLELGPLFASIVAYLTLLFLVAYAGDKGWIPARLIAHPVTYTLSLGVYATSWTYYGSVGFAQSQGYLYLTIYLGVTVAFALTPVLLAPLLRLTREYQLNSLADLFAFRYRSQAAGALVTLFMLAGALPYIALQIRAVTESLGILTQEAPPRVLALGFCVTLTLFAILFGARHVSPREKHLGLVGAIAFESLIKLAALLGVAGYALFGIFDGPSGMQAWLDANPEKLVAMYRPAQDGEWNTLLVLAFAAAFLLPRQFHMLFAENLRADALRTAAWALPFFLFLLAIATPPILWAASFAALDTPADYHVLGIALHSGHPWLALVAFIGGVSAASAMLIVTTLSLSSMSLNHLLLPASYPDPELNVYRWVLWGRRLLIMVIVAAGYGFTLLLEKHQGLVQLGLLSFVAVAQFLPGIVGVIYWPRATRAGFISGLLGGASVWGWALILPLLHNAGLTLHDFGVSAALSEWNAMTHGGKWSFATFWSLALNATLFAAMSLATRPSDAEQEAAGACCRNSLLPPVGFVEATTPAQFASRLSRVLGADTAQREVESALTDLGLNPGETRPSELRRLRDRIERNLSGLIGPQLARMVVEQRLALSGGGGRALADTMRFMEDKLEQSRTQLRGLAAELDQLRRYHREILQHLPLGVVALGERREVVLWNNAIGTISGISRFQALSQPIDTLPTPWDGLLGDFLDDPSSERVKRQVRIGHHQRWFTLHKASIAEPLPIEQGRHQGGNVILIEDLTGVQTLEAELAHSERLASIGRLAAGVAHEIGNPLTGISSLAQLLRSEDDPDAIHESVEMIVEQSHRIRDIVQTLVNFSHAGRADRDLADASALAPVAIQSCVAEAVRLVSLSRDGKQIDFRNGIAADVFVHGDRQRLCQVLVNLLSNAADASQPADRVEIQAAADQDHWVIAVRDQGHGIPAELREHIFEPFFTTKDPGQGTGLGLPLAFSIVRDHGGAMSIEDNEGGGTVICVRLPKADAQHLPQDLEPTS
ncbi:MAG: histidine kinase [Gammaproteobacteria bacterium]|nr:histidine kinase [Gammaproteobacteria bacterium]MCP5135478.1 histidine kinase [Gammaproteobacteria bacterium]